MSETLKLQTQRTKNLPLWGNSRDTQTIEEAIEESINALSIMGANYSTWVVAFSGGKDSAWTAALTIMAIQNGYVAPPKKLIIVYSDTGRELPHLRQNAVDMLQAFRNAGIDARMVMPTLDNSYWVKVLGYGVQPSRSAMPWCKRVMKVEPIANIIKQLHAENNGEKFLMISGVRIGESAVRDIKLNTARDIATQINEVVAPACSSDGGECGTGYWLDRTQSNIYDGLPLIAYFRECHVYDALNGWFDEKYNHQFLPFTKRVAKIYGQQDDGLIEGSKRFGCTGCTFISEKRDPMLESYIKIYPKAAPLRGLRPLQEEMRKNQHRIIKRGGKDGTGHQTGALTPQARLYFLDRLLEMQAESEMELVTPEQIERIKELIAIPAWPKGTPKNPIVATEWVAMKAGNWQMERMMLDPLISEV